MNTLRTSHAHRNSPRPLVIAHRGACAYLPEHTLAAKALAYGMGADYLEQDVVMSKDEQLIVLHDVTLDRTTNVAQVFPERRRKDARFYAIDFTLDELLQLQLNEAVVEAGGRLVPQYPGRFPLYKSNFKIHTLADEIELAQGLNISSGRAVGIYPEIKRPDFHRENGKDLAMALLSELKRYGYTNKDDSIFVQTFDFQELKRLRETLMPELGIDLKLVQLIANDEEGRRLTSPSGLKEVARYADAIGPEKDMILSFEQSPNRPVASPLLRHAKELGLAIHPYTFRADQGLVPPYVNSFDELLALFVEELGIDGLFTDFTDKLVAYLNLNS
ncbi:MAG: glycerophosphodiester phosphodiesterase [Pseudohongiellaceae bacterium]|nr:glycerophosphodiester phosphodiesterase [Pseudohongiellaceae bacterium]